MGGAARASAERFGIDAMAQKLAELYTVARMNRESRELYLRLLSYVRPYAKVFALAVLGMVLAAATEPLFPALIKPLLDGGFAQGGRRRCPPRSSPRRSSACSWCAASSPSARPTA